MTKPGAFLLKRLKLIKLAFISLVGASLLFSCKSTPDMAQVDPIELLDGDAALYITIPVQANQEFFSLAVQKISAVTEGDAKKITERLDTAFVSVSPFGDVQLSASGKIPQTFIGMALNEKKGWLPELVLQQTIYTHMQTKYQLCLPSSSNAFLSRNIRPMVSRFNKIAYSEVENQEKLLSESLDDRACSFLHEVKSSDILIFAPSPKNFIKTFIGADVNTPVSSVYARLSQYRGVKDQFNVFLVLNLSDPRTTKACTALLKTLLFGVPAKIQQTGAQQITIADLPLSQNRILSMFW